MKIALALLLLFSNSAHSAECVSYAGETTLAGKLVRHTFPEQPNYESIEKGDAAATYFFVSLRQPICVAEGKSGDGTEPAESSVAEVQLVFTNGRQSYRQLRPYLEKQVICRGSIDHAQSGHHHSPVLLFNAKCRPTQHSTRTPQKRGLHAEDFKPGMEYAAQQEWIEILEGGVSFRLTEAGFAQA